MAGNYLCVPCGTDYLYDLSPLKEEKKPVLLAAVNRVAGMGSGSVGMTMITYEGQEALLFTDFGMTLGVLPLAQLNAEKSDSLNMLPLQVSKEYTEGTYQGGPEDIESKDWDINNVALLTDRDNNAWIIEMASKQGLSGKIADLIGEQGVNYEDALTLYKVTFNGNQATVTGPVREMQVQTYDNYLLALGSHFRFASTAQAINADSFAVFSTPSLPGNMALGAVDNAIKAENGFVKPIADFVNPPTLAVNAFLPQETCKTPLNYLYDILYWLLSLSIFQ